MLSPLLESITAEESTEATNAAGEPVALDLVTVNTDDQVDLAREFGVRVRTLRPFRAHRGAHHRTIC